MKKERLAVEQIHDVSDWELFHFAAIDIVTKVLEAIVLSHELINQCISHKFELFLISLRLFCFFLFLTTIKNLLLIILIFSRLLQFFRWFLFCFFDLLLRLIFLYCIFLFINFSLFLTLFLFLLLLLFLILYLLILELIIVEILILSIWLS